jgi:hypothetical protein
MGRQAQLDPVDEWWRSSRSNVAGSKRKTKNRSPLRPSPVRPHDFLVPVGADRLKLFGACAVCGAGLAVLWVYFPVLLVAILLDESFGVWKWAGMGVFAAAVTAALFRYALAEEEKYLEELAP